MHYIKELHDMQYIFQKQNSDVTLYSLAQQCTCFFAQGVQPHSLLCSRPLIHADTLFIDPALVGLLGDVTTYIDDCITILCDISSSTNHSMVLSIGHDWITNTIDIWKYYLILFQVPTVCIIRKIFLIYSIF